MDYSEHLIKKRYDNYLASARDDPDTGIKVTTR